MAEPNHRRLATAIVAAYIADIVFNMFYHGHFMMPAYLETASMWRNMAEMKQYMAYCYLGHLILVSIAGIIFARGYDNKGLMEGFRFGLLIGLFMSSQIVVGFAYNPWPNYLFTGWIVGSLLEGIVIGLMLAMVYRMRLVDAKPVKAKKPAKKSRKK